MQSEARNRPRLTPKGERVRGRIIEAAARLVYKQGVAGTTLEDVKRAAGVSGSQMYHYFPDKEQLVQARASDGRGGCPLGSLTGQLAETDPRARALLATGFEQWQAAIGNGLRRAHSAGRLPAGVDPDDLAVTVLAAIQGGLLLAQAQRDSRPLETAVDTLLALVTPG